MLTMYIAAGALAKCSPAGDCSSRGSVRQQKRTSDEYQQREVKPTELLIQRPETHIDNALHVLARRGGWILAA
jgi:hypothetical protein